jgi:hypothetical protein
MSQLRIKMVKLNFYLHPFQLREHNGSPEPSQEAFTQTLQKVNPFSQYACRGVKKLSRLGRHQE